MKSILGGVLGLLVLCAAATPVRATIIAFDVANISGSTFQYNYTITNNSLSVAIGQFTIFFDVNLFQNLQSASAPVGWDPLVIQPDPLLSDDGFYDVLALTSPGIAVGGTLSGFSVQFDFLGAGVPGAQFFNILDPLTFAVLDSGVTVRSVVPVPEPNSLGLMALGLIAIGAAARCRRHGA